MSNNDDDDGVLWMCLKFFEKLSAPQFRVSSSQHYIKVPATCLPRGTDNQGVIRSRLFIYAEVQMEENALWDEALIKLVEGEGGV